MKVTGILISIDDSENSRRSKSLLKDENNYRISGSSGRMETSLGQSSSMQDTNASKESPLKLTKSQNLINQKLKNYLILP